MLNEKKEIMSSFNRQHQFRKCCFLNIATLCHYEHYTIYNKHITHRIGQINRQCLTVRFWLILQTCRRFYYLCDTHFKIMLVFFFCCCCCLSQIHSSMSKPTANTSGFLWIVYVTTLWFHEFLPSLSCNALWPHTSSFDRNNGCLAREKMHVIKQTNLIMTMCTVNNIICYPGDILWRGSLNSRFKYGR